jgi:hypothetical protein
MENWMLAVGFISQWAKANPKVPNIVVVLGVCVIGYGGYWLFTDAAMAHGFKAFLKAGWDWAAMGVVALQGTSAVASGLQQLNLPEGMKNALPVTKG